MVDDDSVVRLSIERAARAKGIAREVQFARNGREALEWLDHAVAEGGSRGLMVLLDINMPEIDGFETLEKIAERPALAGVPVFMLSSSDAPDDICRAYRCGAAGYLVKGTTMASVHDILDFVDRYLSQIRLLPPAAFVEAKELSQS